MVRAKMKLARIESSDYGNGYTQKHACFECQYDQSIPEDQRFQKATPSGTIKMQIDNQAALDAFKIGGTYYVDFTPAES